MDKGGKTDTTKLLAVPVHPLALGVITYVTLMAAAVLLVKVSAIDAVDPEPAAGAMFVTFALVHANVAPVVADVMV